MSRTASRLAGARSTYLRSAAHQPVEWYPWGEEAFARAKELDRPILLDIGAVWCHWCHVMDRESYEDPEIARIINELYVPIKVDRDERPDVDARYQRAVMALVGQGGWPLTCFLTPDGDLFWGGTYFPPEDRYGRPGFARVLREVAKFYHEHRDDAHRQGARIRYLLAESSAAASGDAPLREEMVREALEAIRREYDPAHGGFGASPKFPSPAALELLLRRYEATGERWMLDIVTHTLRAMGRGGIYDQIGGGFHRYSTDERWIVPHFEKMLYDNAGLLRVYAWEYAFTGEEFFAQIARGIISCVDSIFSDRTRGGFYASQDADIGTGDDGDYWTWTVEEARDALSEEEFAVAQRYYDIHERGEMHLDPRRNVLYVAEDVPEIARELGIDEAEAARRLDRARVKLLHARSRRPTPFVDTTIYLNWNGMMVVAYLDAARLLGLPACRQFALTTLDRLLDEGTHPDGGIVHRLGDAHVPSTLDDQVQMGLACLAAYQATGDRGYLMHAERIAEVMRERYWDSEGWGFYDVPSADAPVPLMGTRLKPIQDSPSASPNGCAIQFFEQLWRITGKEEYRRTAEQTAQAFGKLAEQLGLFGAAYFLGLDMLRSPPPVAVVVGPAAFSQARQMRDALLGVPRLGAVVVAYDPDVDAPDALPAAARAAVERYDPATGPAAYICAGGSCSLPQHTVADAVRTLRTIGRAR